MDSQQYHVQFAEKAAKEVRKLDSQNQQRILLAAKLLGGNPRPPKAKPLIGHEGHWRVRVGDYRIIYSVEDSLLLVLVVKVGHRRDVYKFH